jgi:hypothetical protein
VTLSRVAVQVLDLASFFIPLWWIFVLAWLLLRTRMVHRKTLDRILEIAVAWAVLFTVPFFIPQVVWPWNLRSGIVVTAVLAVFSVFYFYPTGKARVRLRFQTFFGGVELLKWLETLESESKCHEWQALVSGVPQGKDVSLVERWAYSHQCELLNKSAYYRDDWDAILQNRIAIIWRELERGSSALEKNMIDSGRAHIETALDNVRSTITYLKSPPSS